MIKMLKDFIYLISSLCLGALVPSWLPYLLQAAEGEAEGEGPYLWAEAFLE